MEANLLLFRFSVRMAIDVIV